MDKKLEVSVKFKYSVLKLIDLVKDRPVIWDSTRADFRTFANKDKAWREIYNALDDKYSSSDRRTQAEIAMKITGKWRNIRDAFVRSFKKRATHSNVKKYMHNDRLAFMCKLLNTDTRDESPERRRSSRNFKPATEHLVEKSSSPNGSVEYLLDVQDIKIEPNDEPTEQNDSVAEISKIEIEDEALTCYDGKYSNSKRRIVDSSDEMESGKHLKVPKIETEVREQDNKQEYTQPFTVSESDLNTVRRMTNVPSLAADEDESFFVSILSFVRDIDEDEKLEFRMAVLQLIQKMRLKRRKTGLKTATA